MRPVLLAMCLLGCSPDVFISIPAPAPCARCAEVLAGVRPVAELCGYADGACSASGDDGELSSCLWSALGSCACQGACSDLCAPACTVAGHMQETWFDAAAAPVACVVCLQRVPQHSADAPGCGDVVAVCDNDLGGP